ncbi:Mitochondrial acidic protein mam33 [Massospora cicadina]|nr:Mitochondrial acidic protein mam33 [Massospora cicadina]
MFRSSLRRIVPAFYKANLTPKCGLRPIQQGIFALAPFKRFSTGKICSESSGLTDADLKSALASELKYEKEEGDSEMSEEMKKYLNNCPFKIIDVARQSDVKLVRTFGNETVQITFSIKDLGFEQDPEIEEGEDENEIPNVPVRARIDVIKQDAGVITFDTMVDDGNFDIELVSFNKDSKNALDDTSEAEWKRHALYGGPVFQHLDEDVQTLFDRYIEERGFTTDLALFIPNYIQYKEQKEYMLWLKEVHDFVKA